MSAGEFVPVGIAVMTVTHSPNGAGDDPGAWLASAIAGAGHRLAGRVTVPGDVDSISRQMQVFCSDEAVDAVISIGGTGLTERDVTPEAVMPMFDKVIIGFAALWHAVGFESVGLATMQSRACAGVIDGRFVFCLPGPAGAVRDGWDRIIAPQLDSRSAPCNLVEIMPRVGTR